MKKTILSVFAVTASLTLLGCDSTTKVASTDDYAELGITDMPFSNQTFNDVKLGRLNYPVEAAKKGETGCATVEYVVQNGELVGLSVVDASQRYFGESALKALKTTDFSPVTSAQPIKARARFDYCVQNEGASCEGHRNISACSVAETFSVSGIGIRNERILTIPQA